MTRPVRSETRNGQAAESPAHMVLGLVAALMAVVIGGIAYVSRTNPSGVPAAAGNYPNPVAAATK